MIGYYGCALRVNMERVKWVTMKREEWDTLVFSSVSSVYGSYDE